MEIKQPLESVLQRNYDAVVSRGLISKNTLTYEFLEKLLEEVDEVKIELVMDNKENLASELTDVLCVCSNWLIHKGFNPIELLIKNAEKNEKRGRSE